MSDERKYLLFCAAVMFFLFPIAAFQFGKQQGRMEHASGQYSCQLIEEEDKTTSWKCKAKEDD